MSRHGWENAVAVLLACAVVLVTIAAAMLAWSP